MPHSKFIERLQAIAALSEAERRQIASLPAVQRHLGDGEIVVRQGDVIGHCVLVVSGFLYQQRIIGERSQILAFHVPGDMPCLHSLLLPRADADLVSLGQTSVCYLAHNVISRVLESSVGLTRAFWRESLIDAAIARQWIARLGAQAALAKVAHLICELAARLQIVGLMENGSFRIPMTQRHVADACGLSIVHVNRTIQELRHRRLIVWEGSRIELREHEELCRLADFAPNYLMPDDAG